MAMRWSWVRTLCVLLVLALPARVWANGFRNPPESAAATGQGGGKVTLIESAAAVSHNPANLAGLEEREVLGTYTLLRGEAEYRDLLGQRRGKTQDNWKQMGNAYVAGPLDERVALGFGLTTPYGQNVEWDENGPFQFVAPHFAEIRMLGFNPAFGYQATERFRLGAAVNVYYSDLTLRQKYPWGAVTGVPATPPGVATFEADGSAVGATLGMACQLSDRQSVGFTYRSQATMDYEGDFRVSNVPPLPSPLNLAIRPRTDFETEITFPNILSAGYGVELTETVTFGADVEWLEFSSYDQFPIDIGSNNVLLPNRSVPQNWDDTWTLSTGLDWAAAEGLSLRAGYTFLESPIPSQTLAPTLPDADRHFLSAGVGLRAGRHQLDLAYAYSIYDDVRVTNSPTPAFNGVYELDNHLMQASYTFVF